MKNEIYKIVNKINNKIYIGLTIQSSRTRFLHHLYEARSGSNFPIHRAIRKYGEENFDLEIIISIDSQEELKNLEKFYIKEFKSNNRKYGYNLTEGGDGTLGRLHSEETKEKIRIKAIGRIISEETKLRMSKSHSKVKNEDWYILNKKKAAEISNIDRMIKIKILDIDNNLLFEFESISEASRELNISRRTIDYSLKNKNLICKKYKII